MLTELAHGGPGLYPREWNALIGIVTAIVGNILISFALNIQRYAHIRLNKDRLQRRKSWRSGRKRKRAVRDLPSYGTQLEVAEQRAEANRKAPALDESSEEHQAAYHHDRHETDGAEDERTPLTGPSTVRSNSSSTIRPKEKEPEEVRQNTNYLRSPWWWFGIILMTVGEAGNFIAYGFAPASIVSPLGVVALVSNCVIAPVLLKERFRQRDFWGVLVAVGGAVTVVLSARMKDPKLGPEDIWEAISRWEFELYLGITSALIVLLMWASGKYGDKSIMIDLGLVGLFGGYTVLSTKGVASLLTDTIWRAVTFPVFYLLVFVLVVTAVFQIRYVNRALQRFDSTRVVPIQFVFFTLSVIIGSAVLYREFEAMAPDRAGKFIGGCVMTFLGVYLITSGKRDTNEDVIEDENGEVEGIHLIDDEAQQDGIPDIQVKEAEPLNTQAISGKQDGMTPRNTPHAMAGYQISTPQTPQRMNSNTSALGTPYSTTSSGISPFTETPQGSTSRQNFFPNSEERHPRSQSRTPSPSKDNPHTNLTTRVSNLSRTSISHLIPGPISSPLSSSLNAIVADQLRRGIDTTASTSSRSRRGMLQRRRSNVLDAEGDAAIRAGVAEGERQGGLKRVEGRTRSVSGTLGRRLGSLFRGGKGRDQSGTDPERGDDRVNNEENPFINSG